MLLQERETDRQTKSYGGQERGRRAYLGLELHLPRLQQESLGKAPRTTGAAWKPGRTALCRCRCVDSLPLSTPGKLPRHLRVAQ